MGNSFKQALIIPIETPIETSAADRFTWIVEHPMRVTDFGIIASELFDTDTTNGVASLDATIGSASRAEKATITMTTDAVPVGTHLVASEVSGVTWVPFELSEGDTLFFEHKTAGADPGTVTGAYFFVLYYELIPDGVV